MATFAQNIRKIRGEAIYGDNVRTAIADALEQAGSEDVGMHVHVENIEGDDYCMTIVQDEE